MNDLVGAGIAAAGAGLGGVLVPMLVARLPEPEPDPEPDPDPDADPQAVEDPEEPKELYTDIAARPGLIWKCALAAAVAGALVGWTVGWTWALLILVPLVPVGVALAVIDWRTRLLPSRIVLPATLAAAILAGIGWAVTGSPDDLIRAAIGLVAGRSLYWVLWFLHSAGMGFGDVRLAALLGFCLGHLGWSELIVGMYAGFLIFGIPGLALAIIRWDRSLLKTAYPFGPFMLLGALFGVCLGDPVLAGLVAGGA